MEHAGRHLPNRLKRIRRLLQYSQETVGKRTHIDPADLSRYENGQACPTLDNLAKLSALYNLPVEYLYPNLFRRARKTVGELTAVQAAAYEEKIKKR